MDSARSCRSFAPNPKPDDTVVSTKCPGDDANRAAPWACSAGHLDALQFELWDAATSHPVDLATLDAVLRVIKQRIRLHGLAPADPVKPKGRRGRRPPPPPGPYSTEIVYWDDVDPRQGLADPNLDMH